MPETIYHNQFSAGWCPSDDQVNGRPNCLLQMNNLELDRNGALTLAGGTTALYNLHSAVHTLYSRFFNTLRADYAAMADGTVARNGSIIISGGDGISAAFGTAFNFVLICSGSQRKKDNGTTVSNLGVTPPATAPLPDQNPNLAPQALIGNIFNDLYDVNGSHAVIPRVPSGNVLQCTTDSTGLFIAQTYPPNSPAYNDTVLDGGSSTDQDYVIINGYTPFVEGHSLEFDVFLQPGPSDGTLPPDYYSFVVHDLSKQATFNTLTGAFNVKILRSDFTLVGTDGEDWSTVYGYRLVLNNNAPGNVSIYNIWGINFTANFFAIRGGTNAQFGTYQYMQVNVNNTGSYLAKSVAGPISLPITVSGLNTIVTYEVPSDPQVNQVWLFRNGGNLGGTFYRIAVITGPPWNNPFTDTMGDQAALELNITYDTNLVSISSTSITDKIYDIVGPIQSRWYYFTTNFMYPSDINDPDLVNPSLAVRICGSANELLMWARAVSASVVIVGTSIDCYLLTGTFTTFPDGSVDIYYQSLAVKFPPITYDAVSFGGAVYYLGSDGWRMTLPTSFGTTYSSQNNQLIVAPNTDRLYRGENCYGYAPPTVVTSPGSARFPVTIGKNKLWCFITGPGRCEVYDFVRQYWFMFDPGKGGVSAATTTQDGRVLAFYTGDYWLREIGVSGTKLIDGAIQQNYQATFPYKDNGKPRQRKDTYTFKTRCFTSTGYMQALISDEKNDTIGPTVSILSPNNTSEQYVDLSVLCGNNTPASAILPKAYYVTLYGTSDDVYIEDWSIDYDPRPAPLTYLKILHQNYGTTARKRIYTVPLQIDTLGNSVLIQPICDGTAFPSKLISTTRKQSVDYFFNLSGTDVAPVARDYDWTFNGQGREFEFYGFEDIRNIETFPDPCTAFVIPKDNYGAYVKKRFRTWPFMINTNNQNVTFTPLIDQVPVGQTVFNTGAERATVFHYFTTDVFGIDYSGTFSDPTGNLEIWKVFQPDSVQNLPVKHEYDQVGPIEVFRWGKIVRMALRTQSDGTPIPFNVFMGDVSIYTGVFNVIAGVEDEYVVDLPKGTSGRIMRVELGPCNFTFARYFMKFQVMISGSQQDTELQWITVPGITSQMAGGI